MLGRQESRGLNWLRLAREYNSSFDYDFPDTCRYTSRSFHCTIPLPGHLATILHTLTMYDLRYQIKMADRGPYGLHLDFLMNLEDVVNLMDLFSAESVLQFQQQVWDFEESICNVVIFKPSAVKKSKSNIVINKWFIPLILAANRQLSNWQASLCKPFGKNPEKSNKICI